jgi:hypothetical protein
LKPDDGSSLKDTPIPHKYCVTHLCMRRIDYQQGHMFSYPSPEERVRKDHPLRAVRAMTDEILREM